MAMSSEGKVVHHCCGYPLLVSVRTCLEGAFVVEYRATNGRALVLYHYPLCQVPLRLWWEAELDMLLAQMNAALSAGEWAQVVVLAPSLAQRAQVVGEVLLAEEVRDLYSIALDALAAPVLLPGQCAEQEEERRWVA